MPNLPIVVVGAGAAGLVAAIFAARSTQRPVLLLEGTPDGGRKILVSGGGRCNVLPSELAPERFVTDSSPNTLRKMLRSWPLAEQREFFEHEVGVPLALEAESGKLFPVSNRARDVRDGLVGLARRSGVELRTGSRVVSLEPDGDGTWKIRFEAAAPIDAAAVVLATGGLSLPGTGSDGLGLVFAEKLGLRMVPTYPALTPLTGEGHAGLAGISLVVRIDAPGTGRWSEGGFLFTHRGWSGPAVLDLSDVVSRTEAALRIRWCDLDEKAWEGALRSGPGTPLGSLRRHLPERLAEQLLAESVVEPGISLAQLPREARKRLIANLVRYPLPATGDEGYRKAEVTGGGVHLAEVDPRTMECRSRPGLFLCGEILDAFGPIGGHNFAWAWATGRAAGFGAAQSDQRASPT
ncbi:MAG TPA: aminoacetone oxidase family FAD-binding enzyme [Thermoanaerobaculia bacterium]|jgi:predicted Rossmann fold flavoprotein|nr:aminoacetone oxidase family FAD-binding enzyme [Thermoanaerobaculia bacterium]